jgi:hypothetical protein
VTAPAGVRVVTGAAFLDAELPGWAAGIDLGLLDMEHQNRCVLGQLFGRYGFAPVDGRDNVAHGFKAVSAEDATLLAVKWRKAVEVRCYGYAVLDNLGRNGWSLYVRTGQVVHHLPFSHLALADDQSPRDYAVDLLAALGWKVQGDGSWYVQAWTGPAADTTWAAIEPSNLTPEEKP